MQELKGKNLWRGPELLKWSNYLDNGGMIFPMGVLKDEDDDFPTPESNMPFQIQ